MTALAEQGGMALEDTSLDDALEMRQNLMDFIDERNAKIMEARKALAEVNTLIELRLEETGSRRFEASRYRGSYIKQKRGSASVSDPAALREELLRVNGVPVKDIDAALPVVAVAPVVKADLRRVRKLAEYGTLAAARIEAYIIEAQEHEVLVIEPIAIDVTPDRVAVSA